MRVELPLIFSQFDSRWAKKILGNNTDEKFDFYNYGCLISSYATALQYFAVEEDPSSLNDKLKAVDGFAPGSGLYNWGAVSRIYPQIIEKHVVTPDPLTDIQLMEIYEALNNGFPVLLGIDYNPKTIAPDYHFVLAVDHDSEDENNITIADPLGARTHSLRDYLGFWKPSMRKSVESYTIISGPKVERQTLPTDTEPEEPAQPQSALPSNYGDIVHNSTQWDATAAKYGVGKESKYTSFDEVDQAIMKLINARPEVTQVQDTNENWQMICEYLELGKDPNLTTFENVKRVIAGIKSRQSDLENKRKTAEENEATAQVTIVNLQGEISKLKGEALAEEKLHKSEVEALKQSFPSFDKLKSQYKTVIDEKDGRINELFEEVKRIRVDNAKKIVGDIIANETSPEFAQAVDTISKTPLEKVLNICKRFLVIKHHL